MMDSLQAIVLLFFCSALWTIFTFLLANWPKLIRQLNTAFSSNRQFSSTNDDEWQRSMKSQDMKAPISASEFQGTNLPSPTRWRRVLVNFNTPGRCIELVDSATGFIWRKVNFQFPFDKVDQLLWQTLQVTDSETWRMVDESARNRFRQCRRSQLECATVLLHDTSSHFYALQLRFDADLVLKFDDDATAQHFEERLRQFFNAVDCNFYSCPSTKNKILEKVVDVGKHRDLIFKALRSVYFGVVFEATEADRRRLKDALTLCEISRSEFASLLRAHRSHPFAARLFGQIDCDDDGFASVGQILNRYSRMPPRDEEERFLAMFQLFDWNQDGALTYDELVELIFCLYPDGKVAPMDLAPVFESCIIKSVSRPTDPVSIMFGTFFEAVTTKKLDNSSIMSSPSPVSARGFIPEPESPTKSAVLTAPSHTTYKDIVADRFSGVIFGNRRQLFWSITYTQLALAVCLVEWLRSSDFLETVSNSLSNVQTLALISLVLLRMRRTLTVCRNTEARYFFPFSSLGTAARQIARLHFCANVANIFLATTFLPSNQSVFFPVFLTFVYLFAFTMEFQCWESAHCSKKLREVVMLPLVVMLHSFQLFAIFSPKMLAIHYFSLGLAMMFLAIDRIASIADRHFNVPVVASQLFPSGAFKLLFEKPSTLAQYKPGDYIQLSAQSTGDQDAFHPFSLTSSPDEPVLSVHVLGVGAWTKRLVKHLAPGWNQMEPARPLSIDFEGPYSGVASDRWHWCDVVVLIGDSICATPFASLLKHIRHEIAKTKTNDGILPFKCQKVYFVFDTDQRSEWFDEVIESVEQVDDGSFVSVEMFHADNSATFDMRAVTLYHEAGRASLRFGSKNALTGLRAKLHFGQPNFDAIFQRITQHNDEARLINVFTSAPPRLIHQVELAVRRINTAMTANVFNHQYEAF